MIRRIASVDRHEAVNQIVSECSKLVQKEDKSMHEWVGKVIHWELSKRLKSDHADKLYLRKQESVLENETHKILNYFEILTDQPILARPGLIKKKKLID